MRGACPPRRPTSLGPRLRWPLRRRPRIYLHIGAMKSGTTFLQALMSANRESLFRAGYAFPGEAWSEQSRAVQYAGFVD